MSDSLPVTFEDVEDARRLIRPFIAETPLAHSVTLSQSVGAKVFLKLENLQMTGSYKERGDMERCLQRWIENYLDPDPATSSETTKAQKPLAAAEVLVEEVEGNPGYYAARFFLRPHYQLEGLTTSMRINSRLPSAKAAE